MQKISNSEDAYRLLVEEGEESWLFGLVAFAVIEEQRIEWMKHAEELNGHTPNTDEIQHWYEQHPPSSLTRIRGIAENALGLYAEEIIEEDSKKEREKVANGVIVKEIQLRTQRWPQFGLNVAGGFVATIIFAAILVLLALFVMTDPSPIKFGKDIINQQTEEKSNGKATSE